MQHDDQLIKRITQIIAAFWILMKILCLKLWIKERNYPLVPVIDLPSVAHYILLAMFFGMATWILIKPQSRNVMIALIVTEAVSILADQNRLQPWHYQFLFTFFAITANYKNSAKAIQAIVLITVATYFFSGLQKINSGFIHSVWSVHLLKRFFRVPDYFIHLRLVKWIGFVIPLIEISSAVGLLFKGKIMKLSAWTLIGMHLFILLFLGPLGINYNVVVWPWNVQMALLLFIFFIQNQIELTPAFHKSAANYVVAFFWVVMPILGLFGKWDKFLSCGMYSGRESLMRYYFEDKDKIPGELKPYAFYNKVNTSANIILTDWCVMELGVASVVEPRIMNSITHQLNERYYQQGIHFELTELRY